MTVQPVRHLDPDTVAEVLSLARAAADTDGVYPLAEEVVLRLRHGGDPPPVHLLARAYRQLQGYAQVVTAAAQGATGELVVHPRVRRRGTGRALVTAAIDVAERDLAAAAAAAGTLGGRLQLWAHGDHPGAAALAASLGFTRARVLYQLRRPLTTPVDEPVLPAGVTLRTFRPGADEQAWLALNARAFADHPEQGRWTARDLRLRMGEPWFDPAGFLLAERAGRLVGFHWTKIHPGDRGDRPIGEVYVLGVDPAAHGSGLGAALTLAGLHHLRDRGMDRAMLYVDESNQAAMSLYTRLGFSPWSVDVSYARGGSG